MFSERIIDVQAASKTCIFGTVYVEMEEKPNVLKDLSFDVREYRLYIFIMCLVEYCKVRG